MSVTVTVTPDNISSAWRPIVWEVSSNRNVAIVETISSAAVSSGTGGFARYGITTAQDYVVGDIVLGSGFTGLAVAYNVYQVVTVINAGWFETDVLYVASGVGGGTITRANLNFQMKCETYAFESTTKAITLVSLFLGEIAFSVATHGYVVGDVIFVEGTTSYNGGWVVSTVVSAGAFTVVGGTFVGSETGTSRLGELIGTSRQPEILVNNNSRFQTNPSGHLQSVLTPELLDGVPSNIQTPSNTAIKYYCIRFIEEFDNIDGFLTEYGKLFSVLLQASRAVWQHNNVDQSLADRLLGGLGSAAKFLTNAPSSKKIRVGEEEQLSFLTDTNASWKVAIRKYDLGGTAAAVVYLGATTIIGNRGILSINGSIFNATNSKVQIWIVDAGNVAQSEVRTFVMDFSNYQNAIRFHFENTLGGFDAYTMTGDFKKDASAKKTSYRKLLDKPFAIKDRGTTNLGSKRGLSREIFSEFLSNAESIWLDELLCSTSVFTKALTESEFTPVNVMSESMMIYDSNMPTQVKIVYSESNAPLGLNN